MRSSRCKNNLLGENKEVIINTKLMSAVLEKFENYKAFQDATGVAIGKILKGQKPHRATVEKICSALKVEPEEVDLCFEKTIEVKFFLSAKYNSLTKSRKKIVRAQVKEFADNLINEKP